ncbi:MAG: hypothetical protein KAY24_02055 [Candidatus Eisenbacteria sp.]|nr:hypothetical protein [Candidatus Eisenbacteria bacterium]
MCKLLVATIPGIFAQVSGARPGSCHGIVYAVAHMRSAEPIGSINTEVVEELVWNRVLARLRQGEVDARGASGKAPPMGSRGLLGARWAADLPCGGEGFGSL